MIRAASLALPPNQVMGGEMLMVGGLDGWFRIVRYALRQAVSSRFQGRAQVDRTGGACHSISRWLMA